MSDSKMENLDDHQLFFALEPDGLYKIFRLKERKYTDSYWVFTSIVLSVDRQTWEVA